MKKDYFILISKWDNTVAGPYQCLDQSQTKGNIIHRPDITVLKPNQSIDYIVELDGSFHHSNQGLKKTRKRNDDYIDAQIPFIAIDVLDLKCLGITWFSFLDAELDKINSTSHNTR